MFAFFWLFSVFVAARGLSLSRGYPLVVVYKLLIAVVSVVAEHGL